MPCQKCEAGHSRCLEFSFFLYCGFVEDDGGLPVLILIIVLSGSKFLFSNRSFAFHLLCMSLTARILSNTALLLFLCRSKNEEIWSLSWCYRISLSSLERPSDNGEWKLRVFSEFKLPSIFSRISRLKSSWS